MTELTRQQICAALGVSGPMIELAAPAGKLVPRVAGGYPS